MSEIRQPILEPQAIRPKPDPILQAALVAEVQGLLDGPLADILETFGDGAARSNAVRERIGKALAKRFRPHHVVVSCHMPGDDHEAHTATITAQRHKSGVEVLNAWSAYWAFNLPFALEPDAP